MHGFITLFLTAFLSATLLPMGSEGALAYLIGSGYAVAALIVVAATGNTLGSLVNYYLGLKGSLYIVDKGLVSEKRAVRSRHFFDRYGAYSLWLSWVPVIGDPLTFIAGAARYDMTRFVLIVAAAKTLRYVAVAATVLYLT